MNKIPFFVFLLGFLFWSVAMSAQCTICEDSACFTCNNDDYVGGLSGTLPDCGVVCPVQAGQPNPLCGIQGVPNNMQWFQFIATENCLEVEIEVSNCQDDFGLQAGIYESCDDVDCITFSPDCATGDDVFMSSCDFVLGQRYFLWLDGCNGDVCDYTITISDLSDIEELFPEIDALTAFSDCRNERLTDDFSDPSNPSNASISGFCNVASSITVCPGELIQFSAYHQGNSAIANAQLDKPCNEYLAEIDATFNWSASWGASYSYNPAEEGTGNFIDLVEVPEEEGVYSFCLDFIESECVSVFGPACLDIHVVMTEIETYQYHVCVLDLDSGWDTGQSETDPNGDGIEWLGDFDVTTDEILEWDQNDDDFYCETFTFLEPQCNCPVRQELCILPVGSNIFEEVELFMFRSQFEFCDTLTPLSCEAIAYEWIWDWLDDEQEFEFEVPLLPDSISENMFFQVEEYSEESETWSGDDLRCDSLIAVTVTVNNPPLKAENLGCGSFIYSLDQELYEDDDGPFRQYPPIVMDSVELTFLDCSTGDSIPGNMNGMIQFQAGQTYCVHLSYLHIDGAWWDYENETHTHGSGEAPLLRTGTTYGPFQYVPDSTITAPQVTGPTEFCADDLSNHIYQIQNPLIGNSYIWNMNPMVPGIVVTDISSQGDGSQVSVNFPSGISPNTCLNVVSQGSCGLSAPATVCVQVYAFLELTLLPVNDVCALSAPDISAVTSEIVQAVVMPVGGNYIYNWNNNGVVTSSSDNTLIVNNAIPGTYTVSVEVQDMTTLCSSGIQSVSYKVLEPLESPLVNCASVGSSEIQVVWNSILSATGYAVFIDGSLIANLAASQSDYNITGLNPEQDVTITVQAIGNEPCFDSELSLPLICTTIIELIDNDNDGFFSDVDCDDNDPIIFPGNTEICDDKDNDCNGMVDDGIDVAEPILSCGSSTVNSTTVVWPELPGAVTYEICVNGLTVQSQSETSFTVMGLGPQETVEVGVLAFYSMGCISDKVIQSCTTIVAIMDNDGDGSPTGEDCDDTDPNVFPGNPEVCDGKDNNCDGIIDGSFRVCDDGDNCTVDDIESVLPDGTSCIPCNGTALNCNTGSTTTRVCDDGDPNTVDDIETILDCDGSICMPCQGVPADCSTGIVMQQACDDGNACTETDMVSVLPDGTICVPCQGVPLDCSTGSTLVQSCDDGDPTTVNDVETVLDCNGTICIPCMGTTLVDNDGDGFIPPEDCDDNDPNVFPGNQELCDNQDNNCNGEIDEDLDFMTYFIDNDRDGFGDDATAFEACLPPPDVTAVGGDCDDFNDGIFPGAVEIPGNGIDEDCDGTDATTATYELDGHRIEIYPNPVVNHLIVDTDLTRLSYKLYRLDGRLILSGQLAGRQLPIADLASGGYLLVLESEAGNRVVDRIVKM